MRIVMTIIILLELSCCALLAEQPPPLEPIFNGKDLAGWKAPNPNLWWKVVDGMLVGENDQTLKGSMLYTEKAYGDFLLEAEVRWAGEIDSGIMLRTPPLQVQIGVSRSLKKDMTGSIYVGKYPLEGEAKEAEKRLKIGDWNTIRIQAQGPTFTVWLNGRRVVDYENAAHPGRGPIGLQVHGGLKMKVEFRNLKVKLLNGT